MTLKVIRTRDSDNQDHLIRLEITEASVPLFKELVNRALNCWDSAPKELKELGDMLTHGHVTQDHTRTKINSMQNTDQHSCEEYARIEEYISVHGFEAWKLRIADGSSAKIASGAEM